MYGKFSFKELVTTSTGLSNYPSSPDDLVNLANLWHYLASVRERFGKPIFVNSAYRTFKVNEQVGGTKSSYHLKGRAADIRCSIQHMDELRDILSSDRKQGILKEFLIYPTFFHIAI